MMEKNRIDPSQFKAYPGFLKSPRIVERYWIARALAHGLGEKIYADLTRMLKDPSPNVVCMALKSFGKRRDRQAIPLILELMKKSDHWYVQWHAYNALKRLGWRQYESK
jgi:HEAT repeat protein